MYIVLFGVASVVVAEVLFGNHCDSNVNLQHSKRFCSQLTVKLDENTAHMRAGQNTFRVVMEWTP